MKSEIIPIKSFSTEEEAKQFALFLEENSISFSIGKNKGGDLDENFEGHTLLNDFTVFISVDDRLRTLEILNLEAKKMIDDVPPDYYLFDFTNNELEDLLINQHEWSDFDVALSEKILTDRGIDISQINLDEKRTQRMETLATSEGGQSGWIVVGYVCAFLGGFFGLVIGYFLWTSKKQLPNGIKVPTYNLSVRNHGKTIFILSLIVFPIAFLLNLAGKISLFSGVN